MESSKLERMLLGFAIAILVIPIILVSQSYAQDSRSTWYIGKGIREGMVLTYAVEHSDINGGKPYNMTIIVKSLDSRGYWITDFLISDDLTATSDEIILDSRLSPVEPTTVSPSIQKYLKVYSSSFLWLTGMGDAEYPVSLYLNSWGSLACDGCFERSLQPRMLENITVGAGTFDTVVVTRCSGCETKTWIVEWFPLPVKEQIGHIDWNFNPEPKYKFELLEATVNGAPLHEFGQTYLLLSLLLTTGAIVLLHRRFQLRQM